MAFEHRPSSAMMAENRPARVHGPLRMAKKCMVLFFDFALALAPGPASKSPKLGPRVRQVPPLMR